MFTNMQFIAGEGVVTAMPDGTMERARRYSSRAAVPFMDRNIARQIGTAGFWYVPIGDTFGIWWDKATDNAWVTADKVSDSLTFGVNRLALVGVLVVVLGLVFLRGRR